MARGRRKHNNAWADRNPDAGNVGSGAANANTNGGGGGNNGGGGGGGSSRRGGRHRDRDKRAKAAAEERERETDGARSAHRSAGSGGGSGSSGRTMQQREDLEVEWARFIRYDDSKHILNILMCGWGMTDQDIVHWVQWFKVHIVKVRTSFGLAGGEPMPPAEVDFAENRLTNVGIKVLLRALLEAGVYVQRMKLHHNLLSQSEGVAEFLKNCRGSLRELHLSHNELSTAAAVNIMLAAAAARDVGGAFCYPRLQAREGNRSPVPLWLRLEQNFIDHVALAQLIADATPDLQRTNPVWCSATNKGCTPHSCARYREDPPAIHAKQLANQRTPPQVVPAAASAASGSDWLPGSADRQSTPPAKQLSAKGSAKGSPGSPGSSTSKGLAEATPKSILTSTSTADPAEALRQPETVPVDILRWDDKEARWVKDSLEVPTERPVEPGSHRRIKPETAASMAKELKSLIGIKPRSGEESSRRSAPPPAPQPRDNSASGRAADGEHILRMVTAKSSRRGLQPSGSEVRQANGTPLNRQAQEFVPDFTSRIAGRPTLNPQAAEFTPQGSIAIATFPLPLERADEVFLSSSPEPMRVPEPKAMLCESKPKDMVVVEICTAQAEHSKDVGSTEPALSTPPTEVEEPAQEPMPDSEVCFSAFHGVEVPDASMPEPLGGALDPLMGDDVVPVDCEDTSGSSRTGGCTPSAAKSAAAARSDGCIPGCAGGLAAACNKEDGERSIPKRVGSMLVASAAVALTTVAAAVAKRGRK